MGKKAELAGKVFGHWKVLRLADSAERRSWVCKCACGNERTVSTSNLTGGASTQCASCARRTHGASRMGENKLTYYVWRSMRNRCANPKTKNYRHYGGRGIKVCKAWQESFEAFLADMGRKPEDRSIDRKDNNGDYTPDNCRWATPVTQSRNSRAVRLIQFNGDTMSIAAWAEELSIGHNLLRTWIRRYGDNKGLSMALYGNRPTGRQYKGD